MNRPFRMDTRPRTSRRSFLFTADRPRRIDRVIDYFGDAPAPALLADARVNASSVGELAGSTRRASMLAAVAVRRG